MLSYTLVKRRDLNALTRTTESIKLVCMAAVTNGASSIDDAQEGLQEQAFYAIPSTACKGDGAALELR